MANNKTYTVMKDGKELKELKTLASAKKLADAEGAEVLCEGECVYQGTAKDSENTVSELSDAVAESPAKEPVTPVKYTETFSARKQAGQPRMRKPPLSSKATGRITRDRAKKRRPR